MNLVNICPDIPDGWKGGVTDVARVLGLHAETIRRAAAKGRKNGGIDWIPARTVARYSAARRSRDTGSACSEQTNGR